MRRTAAISAAVLLLYAAVFALWLVLDRTNRTGFLVFFIIGIVILVGDSIWQLAMLHENRRIYIKGVNAEEKSSHLEHMVARLQREMKEKDEALRLARKEVHDLSGTDEVTGLANARRLELTMEAEMERSRRTKRSFSIFSIDLDRFSQVVEMYGPQTADDLLKRFAELAARQVRKIDTFGRWDLDQFWVVLPETSSENALIAAERIRSAVSGHTYHARGETVYVTPSIGIATYPDDGTTSEQLMERTRAAVRLAKRLGRNQARTAGDEAAIQADPETSTRWTETAIGEALIHLLDRDYLADPFVHALTVLTMAVAKNMGLSDDEARMLGIAAQVQNVGNVAIPDAILEKRGPLTNEERRVVQRHPIVGAEILEGIPALAAIGPIVRAHHEWWDGQGYPAGLRADEIPIGARILSVVDSYKALTIDRPYRLAQTPRAAFEELRFRAGTQFDPRTVEALVRVLAPNPAVSERIMVAEYTRAYRERQSDSVTSILPPRPGLLLDRA